MSTLISVDFFFPKVLSEIDDEKSHFLVQREWNRFYDRIYSKHFDSLLRISKKWHFSDYRIVNLQNELRHVMQHASDFLSKENEE